MFDSSHYHPMIVHFPIALIAVGFLADTLSLFFTKKEPCLSRLGFYLMILGTLAAFAGFFTGEFFTTEFAENTPQYDLKETHELFAKITMWIMLAASVIRIVLMIKKKDRGALKWLVYFMYLAAMITVSYTGFLGGSLVFNYMIGI